MAGTIQDMTEQKRAEKNIQETAERLKLSLDGANLGTWDYTRTTDEYTLNERAVGILGEYIKTQPEWISIIHPDDREFIVNHEKEMEDKKAQTDFFEKEYRVITKSGDVRWVLDCGKIVERNGSSLFQVGNPKFSFPPMR